MQVPLYTGDFAYEGQSWLSELVTRHIGGSVVGDSTHCGFFGMPLPPLPPQVLVHASYWTTHHVHATLPPCVSQVLVHAHCLKTQHVH